MRRALVALLGTATGTALLIGAKYHAPAPTDPAGAIGGAGSTDPSAPGSSGSPSADPSVSATASATPPSGSASTPPGGQPTGATAPATTKPGTGSTPGGGGQQPTASTPAASCTTATGAGSTVVAPGEGSVVVTIKVCSGAITSATATISKSNWEPQNTNAFAALNRLTVQYYKTDMSKITFSGATLTSNAYKTSLRSAMGRAGI